MKRFFMLLLTLLVIGLAACAAEQPATATTEAAAQAATKPTTEAVAESITEATTEAAVKETTEPIPDKILEPFFWELPGSAGANSRQGIGCMLEVVDDATVKVKLYKTVLFAREDVESLQMNEELALRIDDQIYVTTVVDILETTVEQETFLTIQMAWAGEKLLLSPAMDGPPGQGSLLGYLPKLSSDTILKACNESHMLAADSIIYQEHRGEGETENLTGADLIQRLKEQPEAFHLENTYAWVQNGKVISIYANFDPS